MERDAFGPATESQIPKRAVDNSAEFPAVQARAAAASAETVSIRMYRGLLGDFFFVTHTVGQTTFKMLIDCGVLQCIGTEKDKPTTSLGKERIIAGVKDFLSETGGAIDLMVATHEHYDHLSGFIHANNQFKDFKIGKVWMAWTEDPQDKLANSYRNKKNRALAALSSLAASDNQSLGATDAMETVRNLLQFYGPIGAAQEMGMAGRGGDGKLSGNSSCAAALDWLRNKAGRTNVSFLKPGQAMRWGLNDAFRAYVLGPPRDDERLRQLDPSKGAAREVYLARGEDVESLHGLAAIHGGGAPLLEDLPFAPWHWRPHHVNGRRRRSGNNSDNPMVQIYEREPDRRIDGEWLGSAENLALKIDGDVNNTSLALALELSDKRVLLFPGDAQVGNWLSWGDQTYPADDTKDGPHLKIEDILARTIFYKVGHHASQNATLRDRGLELMTNPDLCAMIPIVETTAHEQRTKKAPKGWAMPYANLYKRLQDRTQERVLRGDGDIAVKRRNFEKSIFSLSYGANFEGQKNDPLWVELSLKT